MVFPCRASPLGSGGLHICLAKAETMIIVYQSHIKTPIKERIIGNHTIVILWCFTTHKRLEPNHSHSLDSPVRSFMDFVHIYRFLFCFGLPLRTFLGIDEVYQRLHHIFLLIRPEYDGTESFKAGGNLLGIFLHIYDHGRERVEQGERGCVSHSVEHIRAVLD